VLVAAIAWEQGPCTELAGQLLHSAMDKQHTILIISNNLLPRTPTTVRRQPTNREDIMERTRATLVVRKQALSFGSQKIHIAAEMESTSLLQDLLQRKAVMELSDRAALGS
jgi:hypothetical protein